MPYPDSNYPSVVRGYTATQSFRLMNAVPCLLAALKELVAYDEGSTQPGDYGHDVLQRCKQAIAKADGRGE